MGSGWMGHPGPSPDRVARADQGMANTKRILRELRQAHHEFVLAHPGVEPMVAISGLSRALRSRLRDFPGCDMNLVAAIAITMISTDHDLGEGWNLDFPELEGPTDGV